MSSALERKYLEACYVGDIETVNYMIKKEGKTIKDSYFLLDCLKRACDGDTNGNRLDIFKAFTDFKKITKCKMEPDYHIVEYACKLGKLEIFQFYASLELRNNNFLRDCLYAACESGNVLLINHIIPKLSHIDVDLCKCLFNTCLSGNLESVYLFIIYVNADNRESRFTTRPKFELAACEGGNLDIFKLVIENIDVKIDFDSCGYAAGRSGNIEMINYLREKAVVCYQVIKGACKNGHLEIVKLMFNTMFDKDVYKATKNNTTLLFVLNEILKAACENGYPDIVLFAIENGATDFKFCSECACHKGQLEIVKIMIDKCGITDYNEYLEHACYCGDEDFVNALIKKGARNWIGGLESACARAHVKLVKLMLERGSGIINVEVIDNCLINYNHKNNVDVCNLLIAHGAYTFKYLNSVDDFKLRCLQCKYIKTEFDIYYSNYLLILQKYPPYILFVGSRNRKNTNCLSKLPSEIFRLLHEY